MTKKISLADTFNGLSNTAFLSGDIRIDSLLIGASWTGTLHTAANVTYAFSGPVEGNFVQDFNGAIAAWERVANIHFTQVSSPAQANIILVDDTSLISGTPTGPSSFEAGVTGFSATGTKLTGAEAHVDTTNPNKPSGNPDASIIMTMVHELGHALGLKHPENYSADLATNTSDGLGPFLPTAAATYDNTIMSYTPGVYATSANPPQTPMPFDVLAMQYLYGANMSAPANQTIKLEGALTVQTIWSPNGYATYDTTDYHGNVTVNLRQGNASTIGNAEYFTAYGTHVQRAITNEGNDLIQCNNLGDYIKTGAGSDTVFGGQGNDTIITSTGGSVLHGGKGNNSIVGGYGNDTIFGEMGNDTMTGGTGKDNVYMFLDASGATGHDVITNFNPNGDILEFSSKIFLTAAQALAAVGNNGVMHLTDGGSIILEHINHNMLTAGDFMITT